MSLLFALVSFARAMAAVSLEPSITDFNDLEAGDIDIHLEPDAGGRYRWFAPKTAGSYIDKVVSVAADDMALLITADQAPSNALYYTAAARAGYDAAATPVYTASPDDGSVVYCDLDCELSPFDSDDAPELDDTARIAFFVRDGQVQVVAGRYVGGMSTVESHEYPILTPVVDPYSPHRITVRTIPDVSAGGRKALGFTVAIDGTNAVIETDYAGPIYRSYSTIREELSADARSLMDAARLFPSRTVPGENASIVLHGIGFLGELEVDDIVFTNAAPDGIAAPERLFELAWDGGVTSIVYRVGDGEPTAVAKSRLKDRSCYFSVPTEGAEVTVVAGYDIAKGYAAGLWWADGCTLATNIVGDVTNFAFRVAAGSGAAVGHVCSSRDEIRVGGAGGTTTFADAKEAARQSGLKTIVLGGDLTTTADDGDGYTVVGGLVINVGEDFILDLNGHTISNGVGQNATIVNYGTLEICDSAGGGKVVPFADYFSSAEACQRISVQNMALKKSKVALPALTISGGVYCGAVTNEGPNVGTVDVPSYRLGSIVIRRSSVAAGEPAFVGEGEGAFPLEEYLEDEKVYYAYDAPYWRPLAADAFIWCGLGFTTSWFEGQNWRGGEVPGEGDSAIFPVADEVWVADLGAGVAITNVVRFDGDTELHGSSDFTSVTFEDGATGRISGDATLQWTGKLAPSLAGVLATNWCGTVVLADVGAKSPKRMNDIATWGTASSKVVFRGVRGYCHAVSSYTMPYELVLENGAAGYAWKNDAGFTGSVLQFAKLSGSGSFVSPVNAIANYQTIRFIDVSSYAGKLTVRGKRIVLGAGSPCSPAGSITWSDGVAVRVADGAVHDCSTASFAGALSAAAEIGDSLATYASGVSGADAVVVTLLPGGETAELCTTDPAGTVKIAAWSDTATIVDGKRVNTPLLMMAKSTSAIFASSPSAAKSLKFASIYTASIGSSVGGMTPVTLTPLVPVLGGNGESAAFRVENGFAVVTVSNAQQGLWYCLEYAATPNGFPAEPPADSSWQVLDPKNGNRLELMMEVEEGAASGYYRVVVTDIDPEEEEGQD